MRGKNLLNIPDRTGTSSGVEITVNNGVISCSGKVTSSWGFNIASGTNSPVFSTTLPAGNYVASINKALDIPIKVVFTDSASQTIGTAAISAGDTSAAYTTSREAVKATVWSNAAQNTQVNISGLQVMVESGSTATSFEPFVGGTPSPNPSYPQAIQTVTGEQTVEIVGKNLFDKTSQISNGYTYSSTGTKDVLSNSSVQESYITVLPNTTYTLHTDATSSQATNFRVFICEYNSGKGFIQRDVPAQATSNTNTITTTANTYFVRLCFSTVGIDTLQFEKSASPTTYAPYSHQTLPLDLGSIELCKLGTYQDYIWKDGEDWKVHKATVKAVFSASETEAWIQSGQTDTNYEVCATNVVSLGISTNATAKDASVMSAFTYSPTSGGVKRPQCGFSLYNVASGVTQYVGISLPKTKAANIDALKDWLEDNPQTLYSVLATATDTTITDQTLIAQIEAIRTASLGNGANTITNTATGSNLAGDMKIGYYGYNPTNRYDKWLWLDLNNNYEQIGE